ncbi:hypothetical protein [Falsiroseomonas sp.]|uniref:phage head spike fiber domain-containing protein n=1 Tax=Falsiroseomonas sp. TaxID=2870721 RepID=UPI0027283750|nr:hypothetical protein [Falsiroseomonas sp.]MDO9500609.1 hypothetical protein [Falsiroseomonas sp.]
MANMILGWVNAADRADLSGGRWSESLPQAALADDSLSAIARALGNQPADTAIVADLGAAQPVGLVALFGGAMSPQAGCPGPAARYRIRAGGEAVQGPLLDLDFTGYGAPDPRLAFSRDSLAVWIDRNGVMQGYGLTEPLALTLDGFTPPATLPVVLQRPDRRFFAGEKIRLTDPEAPNERWLSGSIVRIGPEAGHVTLNIDTVAGTGGDVIAWRLESLAPRCNRGQDHDPVSHARLGFRIESARTNLLRRSAELSDSAWTLQGSVAVAQGIVAPDGGPAAKLREDGTTGFHQATQSIAVAEGATVAVSVYVRAAERSRFALVLSSGGDYAQAGFDLDAGTASLSQGGAGSAMAARIIPAGAGWLRCVLVGALAGAEDYLVALRLLNPGGSYAGDGAGGLLVWGAQAEMGGFASSYIPTTGVIYTRAADSPRLTLAAPVTGTLLAEYAGSQTANLVVASLNDGTADNQISLIQGAGGARIAYIAQAGVNTVGLSTGAAVADSVQRSGFGYAPGSFAAASDGGVAVTGASGGVPAVTGLDIGHRLGQQHLNGGLRRVLLYPRRLAESELVAASGSFALQLGALDFDTGWQDVWHGQQRRDGYRPVLLATPPGVAARYWRIDLDDQANAGGFLDLARLWIGPAVALSSNFSYGAALGMEADTRIARSQGGALRFEERASQRVATYPIEHQTAQEAYRVHLELQRVAGLSGEVLAVPDPEDTLYRCERVFIARLRSLRPISNRYFQRFATELELEERLS